MIPSGQPRLLPGVCVVSPVCIAPPVSLSLSVLCVCACGCGLSPTGGSQVNPLCNQLPIKPLDSLLLVARSFLQYMWLFSPWLSFRSLNLCFSLACVANTWVFSTHSVFPLWVNTLESTDSTMLCCHIAIVPRLMSHHSTLTLFFIGDYTSHDGTPGLRTTPPHLH